MKKQLQTDQQGMIHLWLVMLLVLTVVGAVGITVMKHNSPTAVNSETEVQSSSTVKPLPTDLSSLLTADKVKELAANEHPASTVSQVSLSQTATGPVFEVEMADGTTLHFNAKTGSKMNGIKPIHNTAGQDVPASFKPAIDFAKAQQIALAQVSVASVMHIELETEDGTVVYSVRFSNGTRVNVNATTGTVIKTAQAKQPGSGDTGKPVSAGSSSTKDTASPSPVRPSSQPATQVKSDDTTEHSATVNASQSTEDSGGHGASSGNHTDNNGGGRR